MPVPISEERFALIVAASGLPAHEVDEMLAEALADVTDDDKMFLFWFQNASPEAIAATLRAQKAAADG